MTMTKSEVVALDKITTEIIDLTNKSDITTEEFTELIDCQIRKAFLLGEEKHKTRLNQARNFMAMLGEKIHEIDEPYYVSSDLILYSDDLERLIAGEVEEKDIAERESCVKTFLETNSNYKF